MFGLRTFSLQTLSVCGPLPSTCAANRLKGDQLAQVEAHGLRAAIASAYYPACSSSNRSRAPLSKSPLRISPTGPWSAPRLLIRKCDPPVGAQGHNSQQGRATVARLAHTQVVGGSTPPPATSTPIGQLPGWPPGTPTPRRRGVGPIEVSPWRGGRAHGQAG